VTYCIIIAPRALTCSDPDLINLHLYRALTSSDSDFPITFPSSRALLRSTKMPPKREPNQQPKHVTDDPTHPNFFFHSNTLEKSRNDPAPVQAALSRLKVDDPSTFGGVSSASMSSSSAAPRLDSFTVHGKFSNCLFSNNAFPPV